MLNRRNVLIGMSAMPMLPLVGGALGAARAQAMAAGDAVATSAGDVTIHPVSHASLVLHFGDEVIYVDPVGPAELYGDLPAPTAMLITHEHGDHFDAAFLETLAAGVPLVTNPAVYDMLSETLKPNATALANGESGEIAGVPVDAVPAYNTTADRLQFHPEGRDNGYVLTFGDKKIYIAGDTEDTPEMRALTGIEVAFLPMNLPYTMTVEQAADAVNAFKPVVVYPYHYSDSDLDAFEAGVEEGVEVRRGNWYPDGAA